MRICKNFVAIDFETANYNPYSACALGIVTVSEGEISEEYYSLIQPPENTYIQKFIDIHGIRPEDTASEKTFAELYPEFRKRLAGRLLVAHNAAFDRNVLYKSMHFYNLSPKDIHASGWACTVQIYRAMGFHPCRLSDCTARLGIPLDHHNALSDARACALLYLKANSASVPIY